MIGIESERRLMVTGLWSGEVLYFHQQMKSHLFFLTLCALSCKENQDLCIRITQHNVQRNVFHKTRLCVHCVIFKGQRVNSSKIKLID